MKISLGTKSKNKKRYLENVLEKFQVLEYEIESLGVESNVSEQPISEMTTITGAINRAFNAHKKSKFKDSIAIGLEGGVQFRVREDKAFYFCVASAYYNHHFYTSISQRIELPKKISDSIKDGKKLIDEINKYEPKNLENIGLTENIISRQVMFEECLEELLQKTVLK